MRVAVLVRSRMRVVLRRPAIADQSTLIILTEMIPDYRIPSARFDCIITAASILPCPLPPFFARNVCPGLIGADPPLFFDVSEYLHGKRSCPLVRLGERAVYGTLTETCGEQIMENFSTALKWYVVRDIEVDDDGLEGMSDLERRGDALGQHTLRGVTAASAGDGLLLVFGDVYRDWRDVCLLALACNGTWRIGKVVAAALTALGTTDLDLIRQSRLQMRRSPVTALSATRFTAFLSEGLRTFRHKVR